MWPRAYAKQGMWLITRYDDVTSLFTDDSNFESRSKLWRYGLEGYGRDLGGELSVWSAWTDAMDANASPVAERLVQRALVKPGAYNA